MRRTVDRLVVAVLLVLLGSCKSWLDSAAGPQLAQEQSGAMLAISRHASDQAVLYEVGRSGWIRFGGGRDAMLQSTTWSGQMSAEDHAALVALLEEHDWFAQNPAPSSDTDVTYRVNIRRPSGKRRRFTVHGECADLEAMLVILDRSARQRFQPVLDQLPVAPSP